MGRMVQPVVHRFRRLAGLLCLAALPALNGCAIHYANARDGRETIWGFGQLRLEAKPVGSNLVSITTGSRIPGLCLNVGRDQFGISFGYVVRQQLAVISSPDLAALRPPAGTVPLLRSDTNALWALGRLRMKSPPGNHQAFVTGKAVVGLAAQAGGRDGSLHLGLHSRQSVALPDASARFDFEQPARRWPGFDLFAMKVDAAASGDFNSTPQPP